MSPATATAAASCTAESSVKLYERTARIEAIYARVAELDGEMSPELEAELDAELGLWEEKAESVLTVRQELLATAAVCADEAKRLSARAKACEGRAKWLLTYLLRQMQARALKTVEAGRFKATRTETTPFVAAILRDAPAMAMDLEELPEPVRACVTVTPATAESYAWNKTALATLAKAHPELAAGLVEIGRGETLRVS
jgi:hypothetical protein